MLALASAWRACFSFSKSLVLALVVASPAWAATVENAKADGPGDKNAQPARVAHLLEIGVPIENVDRIRFMVGRFLADAREKSLWPVLIFEIQNGRAEFGRALDLARFLSSAELDGATTVAYLPQGATGHTVLIAIACDEIAMPAGAEIGNAGAHEKMIGADMRSVYNAIARRHRTIPPDVVLGMLDPALEVLQVETEISREFVLRDRLPELQKNHAVNATRVLIPAGQIGRFTGREAKELGFVTYLVDDRDALARAWGLPPSALEDELALRGDWRPVRINISGPITTGLVQQTERMIEKLRTGEGANLLVLYLESPGGSPEDSIRLANFLAALDNQKFRTVAYIPEQASGDAAFVAIGCEQIVMHSAAKLGGRGSRETSPAADAMLARSLAEIARAKGHSMGLAAALADPTLEVFQYERKSDGAICYLTVEQAGHLNDFDQWERKERIAPPGEHFALTGQHAAALGLARAVVGSFGEFKSLYGLENDPRLVEPTWVDRFVSLLNSEGAGWVLLVLAAVGLYIEAQSPGLGAGGFLAGLCFLLFFWSHYLGGTADWLEILLFCAGSLSILMEIFVLPGVGIFAFGGGALILASILLASQTFVLPRDDYEAAQMLRSLVVFSGVFVGFIVGAVLVRRILPRAPGLGQIVLAPPTREEQQQLARREALALYDHLLGATGVTVTPLTPAGKARFDNELVDVLAEGEFLPPGTTVQVVEVRAHRVLVRADQKASSLG